MNHGLICQRVEWLKELNFPGARVVFGDATGAAGRGQTDRKAGNMGHALEGSGQASVIIEFFGPPGAGKTTFSHSLAARLRDAGYTVEVHLSARPGEEDSTSLRRGDAATTQNLMIQCVG
jgi:RecA/RadA recombinase